MVEKMWPVLKSCKRKRFKSRGSAVKDRLSHLPDEILLSILSSLTMKEAARTSLLSQRWKYLWRCRPILDFEDSAALAKINNESYPVEPARSSFIMRVDHVLQHHLGPAIDELRVAFDLDNDNKSHIDKWVALAFEKHVKRLELDFSPVYIRANTGCNYYMLLRECCMPLNQPHNLASMKPSLTSLCLKDVNISTESIEGFICSCPFLANLCIVRSKYVTSIKVSDLSLAMKYLKVSDCCSMESIDISAPKLLSFKYYGNPISLHIRNASLLAEVSLGAQGRVLIAPTFDSLAKYFSQLEYLTIKMSLVHKLNLRPSHVPALTNLKHLELSVHGGGCDQTLLGWTSLIEACPRLQKLTLKEMKVVKENLRLCLSQYCRRSEESPLDLNNLPGDLARDGKQAYEDTFTSGQRRKKNQDESNKIY